MNRINHLEFPRNPRVGGSIPPLATIQLDISKTGCRFDWRSAVWQTSSWIRQRQVSTL